ncbi:MAG: hypothetical protein AAGH40_02955 [Verrucomicrobiota bacterium]
MRKEALLLIASTICTHAVDLKEMHGHWKLDVERTRELNESAALNTSSSSKPIIIKEKEIITQSDDYRSIQKYRVVENTEKEIRLYITNTKEVFGKKFLIIKFEEKHMILTEDWEELTFPSDRSTSISWAFTKDQS